jgi:TonB family protein
MFDDFSPDSSHQLTRKRMGGSAALALAVYVGGGLLLVSASNKARELVKDTLTQVAFAPPPPPAPEPEPAPAAPSAAPKVRAKAKRAELKPPDQVPLQKLRESDKPMVAAAASGPVDGFLDGVEGGTGNAPKPAVVEKLIPSKDLPGNRFPPYPQSAHRRGIAGSVVVAFDVLPDGKVANPKIVEGPEEFHETVLKTALTWRFQPATLGGKPVAHRRTKTIKFNLEDA